jgi:hypothetical protein
LEDKRAQVPAGTSPAKNVGSTKFPPNVLEQTGDSKRGARLDTYRLVTRGSTMSWKRPGLLMVFEWNRAMSLLTALDMRMCNVEEACRRLLTGSPPFA